MKKNFKLSLNGCLMILAVFSVGMNKTVLAKNADNQPQIQIPCSGIFGLNNINLDFKAQKPFEVTSTRPVASANVVVGN